MNMITIIAIMVIIMIIIIITTKEGERRRISTCSGYSTGPGWKEIIVMVIIVMMMEIMIMMVMVILMMIDISMDKNENLKTQMVLDKAATRHGESVEPALQVATTAMIGK